MFYKLKTPALQVTNNKIKRLKEYSHIYICPKNNIYLTSVKELVPSIYNNNVICIDRNTTKQ